MAVARNLPATSVLATYFARTQGSSVVARAHVSGSDMKYSKEAPKTHA
eukprot:CAMPEP_0197671990 /NCGR_PEP_ID=MMETSP1338-20131121/77897_1 /TAXON_ID=43686 ORGANISM="Pelagodinium beii, Strain RCC1491" /NCGR_SAMPLE_ID=MMETSP1338 /ASSEMBLY_ACC=CAM_ASM_000754 /LENGTH=47 /DNA_ID= /DNA_START= /DNA_END= /DNA_ORIENTATION=